MGRYCVWMAPFALGLLTLLGGCSDPAPTPSPSVDAGVDVSANQCTIGGSSYQNGTANPQNACQVCDFTKSPTEWSVTNEGQSCGAHAVCHSGACASGCFIDNAFVAEAALDPNESCHQCTPTKDTAAWSSRADGEGCGNGQICIAGKCGTACLINGKSIPTGTVDPSNACNACKPGTSTSAWSPLVDGTKCGANDYCSANVCTYGCFIGGVVYPGWATNPANACQLCDTSASSTSWTNHDTIVGCTSAEVCHAGSCQSGCMIANVYQAPQTLNPNNACQRCAPSTNTSQWSNVDSVSGCGSGQVCHTGSCQTGCVIGNVYYAGGALNPANACQTCQPATNTSTWTNTDSVTGCGSGQVCRAGSCQAGCIIDAVYYPDNAPNTPSLGCGSCKASTSTTAWTSVADGTSCGSSGLTCMTGWCQNLLASNQDFPYSVTVDGSSVYWTDSNDPGAVMKVPIGGGAPTTLATTSGAHTEPEDLVVDSTYVYWIDAFGGGAVERVAIGGGSKTLLATGLQYPESLSLQGGFLYWTDVNAGTVQKMAAAGGSVTTLASGLSTPWGIGTDSTSVYFTHAGGIGKVPLGGGSVTSLVAGPSMYQIAVNSTDVFWTTPNSKSMSKVPINGGSTTILSSSLNHPLAMALDASYVYWTCNYCGTVSKMPLGGGPITTLAGGMTNPVGIAVDANYVYYTDYVHTTGRVLKAAK